MACGLPCCCKYFWLLFGYFNIINYFKFSGIWQWANEWETSCSHPPLPANQSGLKIVVAGWAKSGTWTMSHALGQMGLRAYHSQEFLAHVWTPLADEYWMRPENGARRSKTVVSSTFYFAMENLPGQVFPWAMDDSTVLKNLKPEALASATSRCRPDAVALDGIELLHSPILDVSPDVKVILLDWRTFESWKKSQDKQTTRMLAIINFMEIFYSSLYFLPWGLLVKLIDPLLNNDIEKLLSSGGPPFIQQCPLGVMLWHPFAKNRHIYSHWLQGLTPANHHEEINEQQYQALLQDIRERVPPENLLSWDYKTKGWEELCEFLNDKNCPGKGKLKTEPNGYSDLFKNGGRGWEFNCDEPFVLIPFYLLLHWVNWKIFTTVVVGLPSRMLRQGARAKTD